MGVMDDFLSRMKLNPSEYDDEDDYEDDYEEEPVRRSKPAPKRNVREEEEDDYEEEPVRRPAKVTPIRGQAPRTGVKTGGQGICVIKPTSVEEAKEVTQTLLANRAVVLNLEGLDMDIAQRIIDFVSGSCFAIDGNLQKISNFIFIITPHSVNISGDFQDLINGSMEVAGKNR